jgi:hypothetical protein
MNKIMKKEETQYKFIQKVIQHLKQDAKITRYPKKSNIIHNYGLQQNDVDYLYKLEADAIQRIKDIPLDTNDFRNADMDVSIGGYDFKFIIIVDGNEEWYNSDESKPTDLYWTLGAEIKLEGSTVELIASGEIISLNAAIFDQNFGWQIKSEIGDIVEEIILAKEPILRILGANITIEQLYE